MEIYVNSLTLKTKSKRNILHCSDVLSSTAQESLIFFLQYRVSNCAVVTQTNGASARVSPFARSHVENLTRILELSTERWKYVVNG